MSTTSPDRAGWRERASSLAQDARGSRRDALRGLGRRWASIGLPGKLSLIGVAVYVIVAIVGPWIVPYAPAHTLAGPLLAGPSAAHPFGTDQLGRDQLSRVLSATRVAIVVATVPTALALVAGAALGIAAGLVGGVCDFVVMRVMEVLFSFPALVLAIIFVAVLGPGLDNAMYAIAIVYVPRFAVMARSSTRGVRYRPYMGAARLAGVGSVQSARRHVLPNIRGPLIVLFALSTSTVQLTYATLSFLGLGLAPPSADLGSMLSAGAPLFTSDPWLVLFPAAALVSLVVMLNGVGDCFREVLEPA